MELRKLGHSGLQVSALAFGTLTFGGQADHATHIGSTNVEEARRLIDICLDYGVNLFDTADVYSQGRAEEILGQALEGKRDQVLIATKVFGRMGTEANDVGLSRHHLIRACENSLRRLRTDYIDLYQAHGYDAMTPLEETLRAYEDLIRAGKVRYIGCSNFSAWQLMKALHVSDQLNVTRFICQQVYYSLVGRELEHELIPLSLDQNIGILVWGPLAQGFLTGKFRRGTQNTSQSRYAHHAEPPLSLPEAQAYEIVEHLVRIAESRGVSVSQVALNWVLQKQGVSSVVFGARTIEQLQDNLKASTWCLSTEEMKILNDASAHVIPYPYWHQRKYAAERNPPLKHE